MIIDFLGVTFGNVITSITLVATLALGFLLLSRKERSLKLWVTSSLDTEAMKAKRWVEIYSQEQIVRGKNQVVELLNQWSSDSLLALREFIMQNAEAIGEKVVAEPIKKVMTSSSMSILGKVSGESRRANALVNGLAEDTMPENIKFLRDQLINRFPSLKKTLKNPGQIMQLAQQFGIDLSSFTGGGEESSNTGKSRW